MRKLGCLFIVLALVGFLALLTDFFAKGYAESQIASAIEDRSATIGKANVDISSFPFLLKLGIGGRIDHITMQLTELTGLASEVDEVDVAVGGLEMDRDTLLGGDHVVITGVDHVTVTVVVSARRLQALAGALGTNLTFGDGVIKVNGTTLHVGVAGGSLTINGASIAPVTVPVPIGDTELLPCDPTTKITEKGVELSCTADALPQIVLDAIGSTSLRHG